MFPAETNRLQQDVPWADLMCWAESGGRIDAYRELGVLPEATAGEIRTAYRKRIARFHPDLGRMPSLLLAEARTRQLNTAYAQVRNPVSRRAYDASMV